MEVGLKELYQFPVFLDVEYSLWYMSLSPNTSFSCVAKIEERAAGNASCKYSLGMLKKNQ
jgi:hypothetical protein